MQSNRGRQGRAMRPGRPVTLSCAPDPYRATDPEGRSKCTVLELPSLVSLDVVALAVDGEVGLQALVVDEAVGACLPEDDLVDDRRRLGPARRVREAGSASQQQPLRGE